MLKFLVHLALRFRGAVLAIALWIGIYGAWVAAHARLDVFPDFVPPQVTIQTESPGFTAEQVEQLVTKPIESAVASALGVEDLRSESIQGLSIINMTFHDDADLFTCRNIVAELLNNAATRMPEGVRPPRMNPPVSTTMDLLKIGFTSDALSPMDLRSFIERVVEPRLRAVPGVAGVSLFGGESRQLQIQANPWKLQEFNITIQEVAEAARNATGLRPAGFAETPTQRVLFETRGRAATPEEIGLTVVAIRGGQTVLLRNICTITYAAQPKFGDTLVQGRPGVLATMLSQYGANTLDTTRAVESALDELAPAIRDAKIQFHPRLHRPATFIENAVANLQHSLWMGAALVAIVLLLFMNDPRAAIISLTAIPLSLLIAIIILQHFGATMNTMTLGGLALALGEVIDDAIIDVENIVRRLRTHREDAAAGRGRARSFLHIVLDASIEVRGAVVYATIIVACVFLPVIFMSGLQGRLFAPLGIAYVLSTAASLLVALTVTPALSLLWLPAARPSTREPRIQTILKSGYGHLLNLALRARALILIFILFITLVAGFVLYQMGGEFLPVMREEHFVIHVSMAPGTSLAEMRRLGAILSKEILKTPGVATVEQQIGRAEQGEDPWGPDRSEFHVELTKMPAHEEEIVENRLRELLTRVPGIQFDIMTFLGDRIGESLTGETAPFVVQIFGDDLAALDRTAKEAAAILRQVPGAVDVQLPAIVGIPRARVEIRREAMQQFALRPADVLATVETALEGRQVAELYEQSLAIPVVCILGSEDRRDVESLRLLHVTNMRGESIPLAPVIQILRDDARSSIHREGGRRRQAIHCNIHGRDLHSFDSDARQQLESKLKLPAGFYLTFGGAGEQSATARAELLRNSLSAGLAILILLYIVFRNWRNLALVLLNLPFAMVGGIFAVACTGQFLSMGSLVGFVTLFGISTRNSMMLVSHYDHLTRVEGAAWNFETALRGAQERLLPILMTALVTGLALLPIAIGTGEAGREIEGPMAIVITGGLVSSTILNLIVLPVLCYLFGSFNGPHADDAPEGSLDHTVRGIEI